MRKQNYIISLFFFFIASSLFASTTIQHWQTKNGAQVYFIQSQSVPILDVILQFHAGSSFDGTQSGKAALTNGLIGQSAKNLTSQQIADQFAQVGAVFSTDLNRDFSVITLRSLTKEIYLKPALDLLHKVTTEFIFDEDVFNRIKNQQLVYLQTLKAQPAYLVQETFFKNLYGQTPYGLPPYGDESHVKKLSSAMINEFYKQYYTAKNLNILMVGAVRKMQAEKIANNLSTGLPDGRLMKVNVLQKVINQSSVIKINFPANQTEAMMGFLTLNIQDPDRYALMVANYLIGDANLSSLLFKNVREKAGLTYSINSQLIPSYGQMPFVITFQSKNDMVNEAVQLAQKTVHDFVMMGPTQAQLNQAKTELINAYPISMDSNQKLLEKLFFIAGFNLPENSINLFDEHIQSVNLSQMQTVLKKYMSQTMLTVMVGGKS